MPPLCTKGTDMTRPFRFAVQAGYSTSRADWVDLARRVEDLGYSALHVADHYLGPGTMIERTGNRVQMMACLPAMTAAAMATSTLRIGSRMACVSGTSLSASEVLMLSRLFLLSRISEPSVRSWS